MSSVGPESILQFGTGRFLRAFVDLFAHEAGGMGSIVVVQSTGRDRADAFTRSGGAYHVRIRGAADRGAIDEFVRVESVGRALAADDDWDDVLRVGASPGTHWIVSNVSEVGYGLDPRDSVPPGTGPTPHGYPAKLLSVLLARREAGLGGLTILPCELLERNAERLLDLVEEQAELWNVAAETRTWLRDQCRWACTLVDRIVTPPAEGDALAADPLAAVAEPFALWVIETPDGSGPPFRHPAVETAADLEPFAVRKIRVLNGAHTALAAHALPRGLSLVREAVADPEVGPWLRDLVSGEIVAALEGCVDDPAGYAEQVMRRFANPYLDHRLADIATGHATKVRTRLVPTWVDYVKRFGRRPPLLTRLLEREGALPS